jgi:hypothetical protein
VRTTLTLTATSSEISHREGVCREQFMAIPLAELGLVRPVDVTLWPVRVRKGETRRRTREARLIGPGWVDVLGPITSAAGHAFEAFSDGTTLFIHHVDAVGCKRTVHARLQVKL